MSFTYTPELQDPVSMVRLLCADTDASEPVFDDEEITAAYAIQRSLVTVNVTGGGFVGGNAFPMAYPPLPASPLRVAALLLDSLASNRARLASVTKLLDVTLSVGTAAKALRDQAKAFRDTDDESGGFVLVEQVTSSFGFANRWFSQWQRNGQGVVSGA